MRITNKLDNYFKKISESFSEVDSLNESTVLITGATGFIGSLLTKFFLYLMEEKKLNITIIVLIRNLDKARKMFGNHRLTYMIDDINSVKLSAEAKKIDYIFHCASITRSADMIKYPVETSNTIVMGTTNILELARKCNCKSMVFLSSMEVYGNVCNNRTRTKEDELGDIDILSIRSCYPLGKRMAENICHSYYREYNIPVKIARLAQIFGAGILSDENRIYAQFANAVLKEENIVLHTSGDSMGNYCDSIDAIEALIILLVKGENGEAYNIVNEDTTMKIKEMAELVINQVAENKIKIVYDIQKANQFGYAADTGLRLSSAKIRQLGWQPKISLKEMYFNMIDWMREME